MRNVKFFLTPLQMAASPPFCPSLMCLVVIVHVEASVNRLGSVFPVIKPASADVWVFVLTRAAVLVYWVQAEPGGPVTPTDTRGCGSDRLQSAA